MNPDDVDDPVKDTGPKTSWYPQILQNMRKQSITQLEEILNRRDQAIWSLEAFEAAQIALEEKRLSGEEDPEILQLQYMEEPEAIDFRQRSDCDSYILPREKGRGRRWAEFMFCLITIYFFAKFLASGWTVTNGPPKVSNPFLFGIIYLIFASIFSAAAFFIGSIFTFIGKRKATSNSPEPQNRANVELSNPVQERLSQLKSLLSQELISEEDYARRKWEILKDL